MRIMTAPSQQNPLPSRTVTLFTVVPDWHPDWHQPGVFEAHLPLYPGRTGNKVGVAVQ